MSLGETQQVPLTVGPAARLVHLPPTHGSFTGPKIPGQSLSRSRRPTGSLSSREESSSGSLEFTPRSQVNGGGSVHFRSASEVEKWRRSPRSHAQNRAADLDELQEDAVQRERDVYEATVQNTVAYGEEEEDAGTSSELSSPERPRRSTVNVSERSSPPHGPSRPQKASPHPRRRGLPLVASRKPLSSNGPLGAKRGISSKDTLPGTTDERPDSFAEVAQLKRDPIGRLEHFMENNQHPPRRLGSCPVPLPPPDEEESEVQEKLDEPRIDDPEAGPRAPESGDSEAVDDAQTAHSHPPNGPSDFKSSSPIPCPSRLYTSASEASQPLVTDAVFTATQLGMVPPASSSSQMGFVSAPSRSAQAPPPNEDAIEMLREASGQRERQASNASTSTNVPPSRQLKRITGPPSEDSQPVRARPLPIQYDIPRKPTQHGTLIESVGRGGGVQETFIDEPVEAVESRGAARGQAKGEDIRGDHTASDPVAHPAGSEPTTNAARRELIQAAPRGESPPCDDLDELDILKAPSASGSKASLTNAHEAPQVRADAPGPSIPTRPVRKRKSRSMSRVEDASHSDSSGSIQPDPEDFTYLPEKTKRRLNGKARSSSSRSVRGSERPRDDPDGHNPNINVPSRAPEVPILFAHWRAGRYFLGRPTKRIGDLYHFIFLDEEETSVDLHHMRFGSLRVDDVFRHQEVVYGKGGPRLAQVFDGGDTIYVTDGGIRDLPAAEIWLNVTDIKKHFNDRRVSHEDLSAVKVEPANGAQTVASRVMNHSSRQGVPPPSKAKQVSAHSTILEGLVFLTTSADVTDFHTGAIIAANGGELVNEWQALFEPAPDHFGSTFGIESGKTVFLVTAKPTPTPKLMIALAKGVPCLSHTFVRDAVELGHVPDWRSYLISPGEAAILGNFASQLVDPMWGSPSWSSKTAVPVRRPFLDKSILLIASQHSKHDALRSLVAACVHAMGASVFKTDYALDISRFADFDYIVVEDRDKNLKPSVTMERTGKLCNILWLKQCLIVGRALPPATPHDK